MPLKSLNYFYSFSMPWTVNNISEINEIGLSSISGRSSYGRHMVP